MLDAEDAPDITPSSDGDPSPRLGLQRLTADVRRALGGQRERKAARLSPVRREAVFRQEPLTQHGITKHAGDLVKHGYTVTKQGSDETLSNAEKVSWAFWRDQDLATKTQDALVDSHMHGDGILEIEWSDGGASTDPVPPGAMPIAVHVVDPVHVEFERFRDEETGEVRRWLVQQIPGKREVRLHPDRYHHFRLRRLSGYVHGLSTVEVAYHTAIAKIKGDQATGESIWFAAQPKMVASIRDGTPKDVAEVTALLQSEEFVRGWAWDDRATWEQFNPLQLDPEPYYEVWAKSLAAAIGMPVAMLLGTQAGAVTGSEVNLDDYHEDLRQVQVNVLEPFIRRIIEGLTSLEAAAYDILWTAFPTTKEAEARSIRERTAAWLNLTSGGMNPVAAGRIAGLDVRAEDMETPEPSPADPAPLPPVTTDPDPEDLDPEEEPTEDGPA